MHLERHGKGILVTICLAAAALFLFGCAAPAAVPEGTPAPTAAPDIVSLEVVDLNDQGIGNMPSPTPSPEPTPSPRPFSFYAPTVNMTYEELVGSLDDMGVKAKELLKDGFPDPKTYYIIVDKQWQVVLVYKRLDDGTKLGKPNLDEPVRYMICSSGNPDKEYGHDTTSGIWQILVPKERFYQFVNLEAAQYLTLIHSRTYFHSILYDKAKDLSTLVKESYDQLGTKASHACIRLTVPDARWMWYNIGYGTTCEIRDGDKNDAITGAIRAQLVLPKSDSSIRLKAGKAPWTDNWNIEDVTHVLPYKYEPAPLPDLGDGADEDLGTPTPSGAGTGGTTTPAPDTQTAPPVAPPPETATW
jgi:hypothetical protein